MNKQTEDDLYTPTNLVGAQTQKIKGSAGVLHSVAINKPVANGTVTLYDGIDNTGAKIATITLPATLTSDVDQLFYDAAFKTGLYVATTGSGLDVTIMSR